MRPYRCATLISRISDKSSIYYKSSGSRHVLFNYQSRRERQGRGGNRRRESRSLIFFLQFLSNLEKPLPGPFLSPPRPPQMAARFSRKMTKERGGNVIFNQSGAAGRRLNNNMKIDESLPTLAAARRKAITAPSLDHMDGARCTHVVFFFAITSSLT